MPSLSHFLLIHFFSITFISNVSHLISIVCNFKLTYNIYSYKYIYEYDINYQTLILAMYVNWNIQ